MNEKEKPRGGEGVVFSLRNFSQRLSIYVHKYTRDTHENYSFARELLTKRSVEARETRDLTIEENEKIKKKTHKRQEMRLDKVIVSSCLVGTSCGRSRVSEVPVLNRFSCRNRWVLKGYF